MTDHPLPTQRTAIHRLQQFAPLAALILLVLATALFEHFVKHSNSFLSPVNLLNILRQNSMIGIVALGMTFVIILGGIDLSVGAIVAMSGGLGVWLLRVLFDARPILDAASINLQAGMAPDDSRFTLWLAQHFVDWHLAGYTALSLAAAICITLLTGLLVGLFNGLLITKGRLAPFIATLATMAIFRSQSLTGANGGQYSVPQDLHAFQTLGAAGIPIPGLYVDTEHKLALEFGYPAVIFLVLAVIFHILLRRTRFGRYVVAIGCNERAALYSGLAVDRIKLLTYGLLGLITGVAAVLTASRMNAVSASGTGQFMELDVIAAVAVGGTSMRGGSGTIFGTVIGVLILGVMRNMTSMLDVPSYQQGTVIGAIIIAAVLLQRGRK